MTSVSDGVAGIVDGTITGYLRNQSAMIQVDRLDSLERSAKTLSVMYYNDLDRFVPLSVMADAFNASATFLWWLVQGNNWLLSNITVLLSTSGTVMELLSVSWQRESTRPRIGYPYSLVNRMDLSKIEELSGQLAPP